MTSKTTLFSTRAPSARLKRAEIILDRLGMKPGDAFNMMLAQIELRKGLPFEVTTQPARLLSPDEQAIAWTEVLGAY